MDDGEFAALRQTEFWQHKTLDEMTDREWESLCDGCARCCLIKLQDDETEEIFSTDVVCHLLDDDACRCTDYENRSTRVPTCITLTKANVVDLHWMPESCAYRLLAEGRPLYWWHPLVSGDADTVHLAGVSVRGKVLSEADVAVEDLEDRIVDWPETLPEGAEER